MKNILDTLKSGNMGNLGQSISNALGGTVADMAGKVPGNMANAAGGAASALGNLGGLSGMLGSAAIGGLLGALFTGKGTAKVAKGALLVGGTAAAGALAWKFYQKWSQSDIKAESVSIPPAAPHGANYKGQAASTGWEALAQQPQAALPPAENTALLLLEAMVFAARADGHIDEEERNTIQSAVASLFPGEDMAALLDGMLHKPIDPAALAARVRSEEEAHDLYRLSCAAIDINSFMERSYLDGLAQALKLSDAHKAALEQEALAARASA